LKDDIVVDNKVKSHGFGKVITWDTESYRYERDYGEFQKMYNCDFYDGENHYTVYDKSEIPRVIWELFKKWYNYGKITLISHNTKYDLMISGLFENVIKGEFLGFKLKGKPIVDSNIYLNFSDKIEFIDSFNYFKTSLEELAKQIGKEKVNVEEYRLSPEEWNKRLLEDGEERVRRDTEILYDYFMKFLSMDFVFGTTIASTSFRTFRSKYLKGKVSMRRVDLLPSILSYRGGRVEAYRINRWYKINGYDINSLYPYVMRDNRFSVEFESELEHLTVEYVEKNLSGYNFLINCDFEFPKDTPRVPIMVKDDKSFKLVEKLKAKNVWITSAELMAGLKEGGVFKIHKGLMYKSRVIFKDFIDSFYKFKKEAKTKFERNFYKLIMNSLYGKFGQHNAEVMILRNEAVRDYILSKALKNQSSIVRFDGKTFIIHDKEYITYRDDSDLRTARYPVIVASEVTAYARLVNFYWQKKIGFDKVLYTDTDSFYTFSDVKLNTSDELGDLKKEYSNAYAIFYGAKDYELVYSTINEKGEIQIHHKSVLKGIPKHSVKVGDKTYEFLEFPTLLTRHFNRDGVEVHRRVRTVLRQYDKMVCDEMGICRPIDE